MWFLVCSLKCSLCDSKLHLPEWKQNSQRGNWNTVNDAAIQDVGSANVDQNQTIERKANWKSCVNRPDHCNIRGAEAAARNVFWVKTVKKKEFNERCKPKKKKSLQLQPSMKQFFTHKHTQSQTLKHQQTTFSERQPSAPPCKPRCLLSLTCTWRWKLFRLPSEHATYGFSWKCS